jgi:hypothetical protein
MRLAPASQVVLSSSFHPVGVAAAAFVASGDYVLFSTAVGYRSNPDWIVINDRLGTRTALDPQCDVLGLGPPWVLMICPSTSTPPGPDDIELYSLTNGTQRTVTPIPGVPYCPFGPGDSEDVCAAPAAVGADWIRWNATCYNCAVTSYFQNIQTGEVLDDPTNATTYADLNSPTLAHKTCSGVRLMRAYPPSWGSLTPDGQFALVSGGEVNVFLERCGARMHRALVDESSASAALAWNAGAIVWQAVTGELNGLFLPSLQTFTIPLPAAIVKPPGAPEDTPVLSLALTSGSLYVEDFWDGTIWRTASPTALPLNTSGPSLARSGSTLTCMRGRWRSAVKFSYEWRVNGTTKEDVNPRLTFGKTRKRRSVSCSVTASDAAGTTTASSAPLHMR